MSRKLVIDLPDSANLPPDVAGDQVALRDAIAVVLYKNGRLSPVQARELMGVTRREFEERLASYGFAMMDTADLEDELRAADRLSH